MFGALSIPPGAAYQFFKAFPEIYTAVVDANGTIAAYSSGYPLQARWADALISGEITEPELTPDMLLRRDDSLDGACIYIGSVVVRDHYDPLTKAALLASLVSWRVQQLQAASVKRLSIIMTPVTDQGAKMVQYGGAKKLNDGKNRKDGYSIYGRAVSPEFLLRASATIERCLSSRFIQFNTDEHSVAETLQPRAILAQSGVIDESPASACDSVTLQISQPDEQTGRTFAATSSSVWQYAVSKLTDSRWLRTLAATLALIVLATAGLLLINTVLESEHWTFGYLIPLVIIAMRYGRINAVIALAICVLSAAYFFYPPTWSIYVEETEDIVELGCFCVIALSLFQCVAIRPIWTAVRNRIY